MLAQHPRNFAWIVQWNITDRCAMRCIYCQPRRSGSHPAWERSLASVQALRPRFLIVTGGEPLHVPRIVEAVRRAASSRPRPWVTFNTSMLGSWRRIERIADHADQFHVSLDGLGEVHRRQRGVATEVVLDRLRRLAALGRARGGAFEILTHGVLTRDSAPGIRALVEEVHRSDPEIRMSFGAMEPYDHPLSLARSEEGTERFLEEARALRHEGHLITVVGPMAPRELLHFSDRSPPRIKGSDRVDRRGRTRCLRQFFRATVMPDGRVTGCKPDLYAGKLAAVFRRQIDQRRPLQAMATALFAFDALIMRRHNPTCPFPCKCEEFLDELLGASHPDEIPPIRSLQGRFSRGELAEAARFLNEQRLNAAMHAGMLQALLVPGEA